MTCSLAAWLKMVITLFTQVHHEKDVLQEQSENLWFLPLSFFMYGLDLKNNNIQSKLQGSQSL